MLPCTIMKEDSEMKQKIKTALINISLILGAALLVVNTPKLHRTYIRSVVSDNVVMLLTEKGGGTGWVVNTPNGNQVTVTNNHICEGMDYLLAKTDQGEIFLEVLERSAKQDVCILTPVPGRSGLDLASDPDVGDTVFVIGHPYLLPKTLTHGEFTGFFKSTELAGFTEDANDKDCDETIPFMGLYACIKSVDAGLIALAISPGNSGSPVVNVYGNVVGVVYAGYQIGISNLFVPSKFVADLIKMY